QKTRPPAGGAVDVTTKSRNSPKAGSLTNLARRLEGEGNTPMPATQNNGAAVIEPPTPNGIDMLEDYKGRTEALSRSQAVIEFDLEGKILTANENFCNAMGYRLDEIQGRHHRMFVPEEHAASAEYRKFWDDLGRGEHRQGEFLRFGKGG